MHSKRQQEAEVSGHSSQLTPTAAAPRSAEAYTLPMSKQLVVSMEHHGRTWKGVDLPSEAVGFEEVIQLRIHNMQTFVEDQTSARSIPPYLCPPDSPFSVRSQEILRTPALDQSGKAGKCFDLGTHDIEKRGGHGVHALDICERPSGF